MSGRSSLCCSGGSVEACKPQPRMSWQQEDQQDAEEDRKAIQGLSGEVFSGGGCTAGVVVSFWCTGENQEGWRGLGRYLSMRLRIPDVWVERGARHEATARVWMYDMTIWEWRLGASNSAEPGARVEVRVPSDHIGGCADMAVAGVRVTGAGLSGGAGLQGNEIRAGLERKQTETDMTLPFADCGDVNSRSFPLIRVVGGGEELRRRSDEPSRHWNSEDNPFSPLMWRMVHPQSSPPGDSLASQTRCGRDL